MDGQLPPERAGMREEARRGDRRDRRAEVPGPVSERHAEQEHRRHVEEEGCGIERYHDPKGGDEADDRGHDAVAHPRRHASTCQSREEAVHDGSPER